MSYQWKRNVDGVEETMTLVLVESPHGGFTMPALRLTRGGDEEGEERYIDMEGEKLDAPVVVDEEPAYPSSYDTWGQRMLALVIDEWVETHFDAELVDEEEADEDSTEPA
jgi:hypothetical protein